MEEKSSELWAQAELQSHVRPTRTSWGNLSSGGSGENLYTQIQKFCSAHHERACEKVFVHLGTRAWRAALVRRTRAAGMRSWRGGAVAHDRTSTVAVHRAQTSEHTRRHHFIRGHAE